MQLTIRIPDEYMSKIDLIAKKMGLRKSDITRMAIRKFVDEYGDYDEKAKPYDKVKHLLGIAESGISDLGQNHRKHLVDKIKNEER